jgi:hypothetical protein
MLNLFLRPVAIQDNENANAEWAVPFHLQTAEMSE